MNESRLGSTMGTAAGSAGEDQFLGEIFDRLFPICRSIAGPGLRESLEILAEHCPFEFQSVPSGSRVFDWTVPPEWHIKAAKLTGPDGKVYADFNHSNLSVMSFSEPVDRRLTLDELRLHLHSIPKLPEATPYVTSYYKKDWGFCLPHSDVESLPDGEYHAYIDSSFVEGELVFADCIIPGESEDEVLLSTYLCHPSLANNELGGPLALLSLYHRIARWPRRRFTYRFVVNPETIGSLAYLSVKGEHLRRRLVAGLILTCLGGPMQSLSYKTTRRQNALIDQVVKHMKFMDQLDVMVRPFTPTSGSDERQYCSPGFNLPVGQIARTVYGQYAGYHNSLDTKEFMDLRQIVRSADAIEKLLKTLEYAGKFENQEPYGEPQLGRRNLYPHINSEETRGNSTDTQVDSRMTLNWILNILSYSDSHQTMIDIAERCGCAVTDLIPIIDKLESEKLLRFVGGNTG